MNSHPGKIGVVIDVARYAKLRTAKQTTDTAADSNKKQEYDALTDEVYTCFLDCAGEPVAEITKKMIGKFCKDKGGKCYKSPAKSAKFVVIMCDLYQNEDRVTYWHNRGYKVTDIDSFSKYAGLI